MAKKPAYRAGRDQAATAENVELLTGQRGDRLDKAVTFRELSALGLSTLRPGAGGVYVPGKNPDLFPAGQMEFPHAPVNVIANGAFHTVLVEWDSPRYRGHAHAEIWRAESDNQAEATLVGTSSANLFSDAIGKGATFYYWVRFVNGKDDRGPFQGMQGVKAETSRDVQDILDELQGKIEESHLAQALLRPIEQVPQLQLDIAIMKPKVDEIEVIRPKVAAIEGKIPSIEQDIAILKPKVDEIEVIRPKVAAIEGKIPSIEQELAGLDERQKVAQDLLDDAQQQLGMSSIEIGLVQDRLNAKIDKYKGDFDSFRDAVFVVDPESGSITMDAVNAVRDELHTSITEVYQDLDAVAGQITSKADNVTVDSQGRRITEAEQRINGLDASLSQTVTRGEFTGEQQRVTQIGQELDATKGVLAQKATQQEVDEQGERLANAESKLTVHTDELSSQAQRLDGLAAQITQGDETLRASITELARVSAESDQVTTQRVSGLEVRAGASEAKIQALEEIFADDSGITAGRFDAITAELELQRGNDDDNASAAIDGALAVDERDRETRKAFGAIRTEQRVILTEQQAQAQRTADMEVKFEAKDAATQARISSVEKVTSDADSALAQRIDNVTAEFQAADTQANADIRALEQSSASADEALSLRQDELAAALSDATTDIAANITREESARVTADEAISMRVAEVEAQFSGGLDEVNARVAAEELARATKDEALSQQISTVDAAFKAADTALSASLSESSKALSDADRALGERISTIDVTVEENSASITELQQAVVSNEASLSQRQDKMESEIVVGAVSLVEGALAGDERDRENRKARGVILQQQSTLANQQEAQARTVEQLTAEFDAETADLKAQITNEQLVRATADESLSQRISVVDAEFKAANAGTNAVISALEQSNASANEALSLRQNQLAAALSDATAELVANITSEESARVTADEAISRRVAEVEAQFSSDLADTNARVAAEELARATKDEALSQQISTVDAAFKAADTALSASLAESSKAMADADRALGERISTLDVTVGENSASITELQQAVVSNEASLSQRQDKMESEIVVGAVSQVEGALAGDERDRENRKARGAILQQQSTLANQQEAQARTVEQLTAEFDAENAEIRAQITNEQLTRATADEALSQRISVVDSEFKAADAATNAAVAAEVRARSDADSALAEQLSTLDAEFKGAEQTLAASIDEVSRVSAEASQSLSEQLSQVRATAESAGAAAAGAQDSADQANQGVAQNSAAINNEAKARADADSAMAQRIDSVTAEFQAADTQANADIRALAQSSASADEALSLRQDELAAALSDATTDIAANITREESARVTADEAISRRVSEVEAQFGSDLDEVNARVAAEELARATKDEALAQQISTVDAAFKAADTALSASLAESSKAMADADRALGERISAIDVTVGDNAANITELQRVVVSNEEAQARTIEQLTAEFDAETADLKAQITNEQLVRATKDEALSQQISVVDAEFKAANADTNAAVAAEVRARSDADSALAEQLSTMDAEFKGAEHTLAASIDEVSRVSAEASQSLSEQLSQVKATAESAGAAASGAQESADQAKLDAAEAAGIANGKGKVIIQPVAPGASDQLAQNLWIDTSNGINTPKRWGGSGWIAVTDKAAIDAAQAAAAAQEAADRANQGVAQNSAAINNEAKARADADSAMAQQIQQVSASYQQGDRQLQGQITAESVARANAVQSLGSQINTVSAVAGSKNKTFFQATAPSTGMGTGDLWFDTDSNNRPYRYSGTAWVATDDPRIAANAAAVQLQSQAIADLQNGAQAMWTAKASAGQITAGIGLIANSDGTSQVAISASQVFVFDPNSSTPMAPLFAIDNGQVVIAEAIIRKATIQILNSEKITADYVKAGVSISTPLINGGQIDMGNAFLSGGAAGFGKGGPYGGWSWTWHTIIYADGSLYTDRLFASNGSFTGTVNANAGTFQNVTIEETCNVKGTVYASKIVGDVLSAKVVSANSTDSAGSGHVVASASVKGARTHAANLYCLGVTVEVYASGGYRPGGNDQDVSATISGRLVLKNTAGGIIATAPFKVRSGSDISIAAASQSITIQGGFDAGTGAASISCAVIIDSQSASYGGSAGVRVPAQSIAFCLLPSGSQFN